MKNETGKLIEKWGKRLGFMVSYGSFTIIFFFILVYLNKLPEGFSFIYIVLVTFVITVLGFIIKKVLK